MPDAWYEDGDLFVDFSTERKTKNSTSRKSKELIDDSRIDLGSGYPSDMVWTTKDNRRIPVPNMADSHLLNTIAFLRRNVENYKRREIKDLAHEVVGLSMVNHMMFDAFISDEEVEEAMNKLRSDAKQRASEVFQMKVDDYLRERCPQFKYMLQEAYKRKLLIDDPDQTPLVGEAKIYSNRDKTQTLKETKDLNGTKSYTIIDHDPSEYEESNDD